MSAHPDIRLPREFDREHSGFDHAWHVALNRYAAPHSAPTVFAPDQDTKSFMYEAKRVAAEVPRLALLFGMERRGELSQRHRQCSHDHEGTAVPDNHLTCCLGVECRACPHLAVLDGVRTRATFERAGERADGPLKEREHPILEELNDVMKAWTCATHILMRGGDSAGEGYVLTADDRMYWDGVYESLRAGMEPDGEDAQDDAAAQDGRR